MLELNNKDNSEIINPFRKRFAVDNGRGHFVSKSVVRYPRTLSVKLQIIYSQSVSEYLIIVFVIKSESLPSPILLRGGNRWTKAMGQFFCGLRVFKKGLP